MPEKNMAVQKKVNSVFIRKVTFLTVILLTLVAIVIISYVSVYNAKKMNGEKVFAEETGLESYQYKESDYFLDKFNEFYLYSTNIITPYTDLNGELVKGSMTFTLINDLKANTQLTSLTIKLALGANWAGYKSATSSQTSITLNNTKTGIKISDIDVNFPVSGPLPFTTVEHPTLYSLVKWTENSTSYYTYLEYSYEEFTKKPELTYAYALVINDKTYNLVLKEGSTSTYVLPDEATLELKAGDTIKVYNQTLGKQLTINKATPTTKVSKSDLLITVSVDGLFTPSVEFPSKYKTNVSFTVE